MKALRSTAPCTVQYISPILTRHTFKFLSQGDYALYNVITPCALTVLTQTMEWERMRYIKRKRGRYGGDERRRHRERNFREESACYFNLTLKIIRNFNILVNRTLFSSFYWYIHKKGFLTYREKIVQSFKAKNAQWDKCL
jgi:hypothetical protein